MRLSVITVTISMLSLTTAQPYWTCVTKDDREAKRIQDFEKKLS
ncbi:hypothetical protein Ptr902_02399 [Pyrenophora tritici-repentis]|uniref:Uncharacterized protein n=1 Tax=Pyrenophora tritici-repentis TaxID=45151 RepID=A0A5M9KYB7_9PLEO|nr:hypothetical protein PtrV1_09324 [Pyrenophora tritici-repentis]KAF7568291.1 hypothetical protein PtrM4_129040 [Pyrenophora tritici-repentis]KAI0577605.1 hypothetical protein Alg130_08306 [Pyrenophora tritici-repentis]KAI0586959.1 hypothetical protein Alg215_01696 [Pyrenophora tritici-repentis]KAI0619635.1 hypothetical protein TUN199_08386 [Pyrenophora tritici-repentis]